jgi:SAM-dependent methyltransferase
MDPYIFKANAADHELYRLRLVEEALDASTTALLKKTGVSAGWTCLEVGPGAGSILRWLGQKVGRDGAAVAVDKKLTYLSEFVSLPYRVIEGDIRDVSLEGGFDLIHARYVLIHNQNSIDIIHRLRSLLKPGGYLVLEEPDFEASEWVDEYHAAPGNRVNAAMCAMFTSLGLDPGYGKRLPLALSQSGFKLEMTDAATHLAPGSSPVARLMAESAVALRSKYIATGKAEDADIDTYVNAARNPASWAIYYSTVAVIARAATGENLPSDS